MGPAWPLASLQLRSRSNSRPVPGEFYVRVIVYRSSVQIQANVIPAAVRAKYQVRWSILQNGVPMDTFPKNMARWKVDTYMRCPYTVGGPIRVQVWVRENASKPWISVCGLWSVPDNHGDGQGPCV